MNSNSDPYRAFAEVYDATMRGVPFYQWAYSIYAEAQERGLDISAKVVDLGCGTATVTRHLATYFVRIIGMDFSLPMLRKAAEKITGEFTHKIRLAAGDFRELPFKCGYFDLAISTHDSLNYITRKEELKKHFREVHRILKPGGWYIFDITSEKNVEKNFHKKTFREYYEDTFFVWENLYDKKKRIIFSYLRFYKIKPFMQSKIIAAFIPDGMKKNLVRKNIFQEEIHAQKVYREDEVISAMSGLFIVENKIADYDPHKPLDKANIIAYVVRAIV